MKHLSILLASFALALLISCGGASKSTDNSTSGDPYADYNLLPSGVMYYDVISGKGEAVKIGSKVKVHYIGKLTNGTEFDNSYTQKRPLEFTVGDEKLIKGWNEGIMGMRAGGKRNVVVPPAMGYGDRKVSNIPANSTLVFEIELLDVMK